MKITDEMVDAVAERIYEDAHAGISNVWCWHDGGLDHEHPDVRERFIGYARSALATQFVQGDPPRIIGGDHSPFTVSRAAENYVAERGFEHSGGIIESAFEDGAKWAEQSDMAAIKIADAVIAWMVNRDFADPGTEVHASDVLQMLDSLVEDASDGN